MDVEKAVRTSLFNGGQKVDPADLPNVEFKLRGPGGDESGEVVSDLGKAGGKAEGLVKITGREIGDHVLEMWVDGELVDSKNVNVKGPELKWGGDLGGSTVGQKSNFSVDLAGIEGEGEAELEKRREHLTVVVKGPDGVEVPVEVGKSAGGGLDVSYIPQQVGDHEVKVLYKGKEVESKTVPAYKLEWGGGVGPDGVNKATVGVLSEFELGVVGADGRVGGDDVEVVLVGENGKEIIAKDMGEGADGKRKYGYVPQEAGDFQLQVRVKGEKVGGVPVEVSDLEAEWGGDGLEGCLVGQKGEFDITFFDQDGEMVKVAEEPKVRVVWLGEGGEREEVDVDIEMEDETVKVGYVPKKAGKHLIEVVVGDTVVKSKEVPVFDVKFKFGADWERDEDGRPLLVVDVPKTVGVEVSGGADEGDREKLGVLMRNVETGEEVEGRWTKDGEWEGKGDGLKGCELCGTSLGVHELLITYDGTVIGKAGGDGKDSEVRVKGLHLESWGPGLKAAVVGRPATFYSIFREKEGGKPVDVHGRFSTKIAYKNGGDSLEGAITEGEGEEGPREACNKVVYTPTKAGKVDVGQWYRTWEERVDEARVFGVNLTGLDGGPGVVGVARGFEVGVWDSEDGKGLGLPEGVEVVWREVGGDSQDCSRHGEGEDGRTKCSFTPETAGTHVVEVRMGGEVLASEEVKVRGITVEVGGFGSEGGVVGVEGDFWVRFRDGETGELVDMPEGVEVEVEGRAGSLGVTDRGVEEGGKGYSYTPNEAGKTNVKVKVKGNEVFSKDIDVYQFVVGRKDGGDVLVNDPNNLSVEVLGEGGKKVPLSELGDDIRGLVTKDGQESGSCGVSGNDQMTFSVNEQGEQKVAVCYKGKEVGAVDVRGVGPSASGEGLEVAFLGFPAKFVVEFPEPEGEKKKKSKIKKEKKKEKSFTSSGKSKKEKKEKGSKKEKKKSPARSPSGEKDFDMSRIKATVTIDGKPVEVEGVKIGDRAMEYTYVATTPGEVSVNIEDNGKNFFSNNFGVVKPDWVVSGSGSKFAKCDMENYFHVSATDPRNGNNLLGSAGDERVKCRVKPPSGDDLPVRCQFHPKRGMGGVFTPNMAGEHTVQVMANDKSRDGAEGKERVLHEFKVPTCRYDFDGDAMMGCCAKMEAKFTLEIFNQENAPPLPPDEIVTTIKYVEGEGEVTNLVEQKTAKDVTYSFTPMNRGELEILVEHKGNVVYQGQLQVGLPR